tara:strand:+ start:4939 stop:6765 length:1827 start_codon:yes stop_codon:yes gene_type:complete
MATTSATAKYKIILEDKTKRAFGAIGRSLKSITRSIFSMKSGFISAAGIAGLGFFVKKSMNATDEMAKMSRAIGVSVEELSALRHAASLGGLEATQLDKAVQKLAINMADMSRGVGLAKDVFEKHNISVANADGELRTVMEVMSDVADVTAGMTNATEKADLAYKLFGARGAKMINMLEGGADGMRAAMKEAEMLGLVMSSETAKGVEDANDSFTRLSAFMSSTFAQTVGALAPAIRSMTDALIEFITLKVSETDGGIAAIASSMANAIIDASINILRSLENITEGVMKFTRKIRVLLGMATNIEVLQDQLDGLSQTKIGFNEGIFANEDDLLDRFRGYGLKVTEVVKNIFTDINATEEINASLDSQMDALEHKIRMLTEAGGDVGTFGLDFSGIIEGLKSSRVVISLFESDIDAVVTSQAALNDEQEAMVTNDYFKAATDSVKQYGASIKTVAQGIGEATMSLMKGTEDAIMSLLEGTKFSWKNLFKGIMMDLARIQVKSAVLGVAKSIFGISFNGGGYTGNGPRTGGLDGKGGFPAILHPNETVVDHTKGGQGGGGTFAEITFNVQAIDSSSFNSFLVNNRDTVENIINNSLINNGTVRKTINMVG